MTRQLPLGSQLLAGVVALALAFVSAATCFAAVMQMPETQHHTCCAGMNRDCGGDRIMVQKDCCAVQSADLARLRNSSLSAPVITISVIAEATISGSPLVRAFDPGVPKPSSSPTYLLVSVFRL